MVKRLYLLLTLVILTLFLVSPSTSQAEIALMDGKLILSGFVKNTTYYRLNGYDREFSQGSPTVSDGVAYYASNHNTHWDFSHFSGLIEALYTIKEDQDSTIRIFTGLKAWYNVTPDYDDKVEDAMASNDRRRYQTPRSFDDVVGELYLDYINGPWQIRTGKQIVIWGQLDMSRVADVVNPLDLRWGVPGVDTWEEVKQGLWMIRTFYQSQLPGNLLFEAILNPGYYRGIELPYEGTHWGPEHFSNYYMQDAPGWDRSRGLYSNMQSSWRHSRPDTWNSSNYEVGGRVQGYTWNIDWTLLIWNAKSDGPSGFDDRRSANYPNGQYNNIGRPDITNGPVPPNRNRGVNYVSNQDAWDYRRYTTYGGTAQTFTGFLNTVWRLEWFFEHNSPLMTSALGNQMAAVQTNTTADILGVALQGNWNLDIPWFTRVVGTGKQASLSLTYFREKVMDYEDDMILTDRNHALGDDFADSWTLFLMQQMFNASWTFVFIGNYYPELNKWMAVPSFTYVFADSGKFSGLRADIGLKYYGGADRKHTMGGRYAVGASNSYAQKNSLILRLRYEF